MRVMIVTFGFEGSVDDLARLSEESAPQFAAIPGCIEKTWIVDRDAGRCGGVYKFVDEASMRAYQASELWGAVNAEPSFSDFRVERFEMIEAASIITGGVMAGPSSAGR